MAKAPSTIAATASHPQRRGRTRGAARACVGSCASVSCIGPIIPALLKERAILSCWPGYTTGEADGVYGPASAAIKRFQANNGLDADGIVGPQTRARLFSPQATPSAGE